MSEYQPTIEEDAINRIACIYEMLEDGTSDADIMAWIREQKSEAETLLLRHGVWKDGNIRLSDGTVISIASINTPTSKTIRLDVPTISLNITSLEASQLIDSLKALI